VALPAHLESSGPLKKVLAHLECSWQGHLLCTLQDHVLVRKGHFILALRVTNVVPFVLCVPGAMGYAPRNPRPASRYLSTFRSVSAQTAVPETCAQVVWEYLYAPAGIPMSNALVCCDSNLVSCICLCSTAPNTQRRMGCLLSTEFCWCR
jgi:hypothetical protein